MRKPRDFDAELKALNDKARRLKEQKLHQLGELVTATGADALSTEQLAGVLLMAAETSDTGTREGWYKRGVAFFQVASRQAGNVCGNAGGAKTHGRDASSATSQDRA
ncbi:conjugal transfer protein TraD [Sphingomonas sp.]|uniref:conjugal transfer protein TraD n=1 Tax=Sphingomonas sp. TaxID=28214 RepID=UPI003D6D863A